MKKYLSKAMAYAAMLLMTTVFYACKDDDGPSADTFIGVWEGVEADSWSILPGYVEDGWWAEEPDKNEKYGVDISEYRIEFTADKFYRIYREVVASNPRDNKWSMAAYGKWSNSGNTITLTSYDASDKTYNEESPENFRIVELDKDELILEYHENRPDGENYGKITLRQIADKGDIYEEEEVKEDEEPQGKITKTYPQKYWGEWYYEKYKDVDMIVAYGFSFEDKGKGNHIDYVDGYTDVNDELRWFVDEDNKFYIDYMDDPDGDGYIICKIKSETNSKIVLEYTGKMYINGKIENEGGSETITLYRDAENVPMSN